VSASVEELVSRLDGIYEKQLSSSEKPEFFDTAEDLLQSLDLLTEARDVSAKSYLQERCDSSSSSSLLSSFFSSSRKSDGKESEMETETVDSSSCFTRYINEISNSMTRLNYG
jgi:hypothetical protein